MISGYQESMKALNNLCNRWVAESMDDDNSEIVEGHLDELYKNGQVFIGDHNGYWIVLEEIIGDIDLSCAVSVAAVNGTPLSEEDADKIKDKAIELIEWAIR